MVNEALFLDRVVLHTLLKLVRKHGIALVLQGVIEAAKTDSKNPKMQELVKDLDTALAKYKGNNPETQNKNEWGPINRLTKEGDKIRFVGNQYTKVSDKYNHLYHAEAIIAGVSLGTHTVRLTWTNPELKHEPTYWSDDCFEVQKSS